MRMLGLKWLVLASMTIGMAAVAAAAQNHFIGEWKLNPQKSRMPDEMKIESKGGNTYSFNFDGTPEIIVADGTDQPGVQGTTLAVKADGPDSWIVERKIGGKLLIRATWKLSKDGSTLTDFFREFVPDGSTMSMDYVYQRNGGGSGIVADWRSIKETMNSPSTLQVKAYQGDGLTFIMTPLLLVPKNVKFDGKDYPSPDGSTSSIRQVDEHTLEMTDKAGGKVVDTQEIVISPDGKTLMITVHAAGQREPNVYAFERG